MNKAATICDWAAGLLIGVIPLMAHVLLHYVGKPNPAWDDNWSADVLVISITNSGMSAVTIFIRMVGGQPKISNFRARMKIFWALTLILFCLASILYGVSVSGLSNGETIYVAAGFLFFSAFCSYNFEAAFAECQIVAD